MPAVLSFGKLVPGKPRRVHRPGGASLPGDHCELRIGRCLRRDQPGCAGCACRGRRHRRPPSHLLPPPPRRPRRLREALAAAGWGGIVVNACIVNGVRRRTPPRGSAAFVGRRGIVFNVCVAFAALLPSSRPVLHRRRRLRRDRPTGAVRRIVEAQPSSGPSQHRRPASAPLPHRGSAVGVGQCSIVAAGCVVNGTRRRVLSRGLDWRRRGGAASSSRRARYSRRARILPTAPPATCARPAFAVGC